MLMIGMYAKAKITSKNQIVIPKKIREIFDLKKRR